MGKWILFIIVLLFMLGSQIMAAETMTPSMNLRLRTEDAIYWIDCVQVDLHTTEDHPVMLFYYTDEWIVGWYCQDSKVFPLFGIQVQPGEAE